MRRLLILLCAALPVVAGTQITDTVKTAFSGVNFTGKIIIRGPMPKATAFADALGNSIAYEQRTITVSNGALSVNLEPTDTMVPAGGYYDVSFIGSAATWNETWTVPTSGTAVKVSALRSTIPASPSSVVLLSQLAQGGATSSQCLTWNGSVWAPGSCAEGAGTVTSVFGRSGAVVALAADYAAHYSATTHNHAGTYASATHASTHITGGADVIASAVAGGAAGLMTGADKTKLDGIAAGAEVNVNADWSSGSGDSQILNKPTLGTAAAATLGTGVGQVPVTGDYATAAQGVTNGNSHDHSGGDGAQIAYSTLSGTPTLGTIVAKNASATGGRCAQWSADGTSLDSAGAECGTSSMVYPGAGVANSTGSAWGTSYSVGTGANNLVQLDASSRLPAVSAALLTNFPTLNQNTTGTAAGLGAAYIDWSAGSGGASILNKPTLGTAAAANLGTGATEAAYGNHNHTGTYAPAANGVTGGDSHDHSGGDGAQIAYSTLSGTPTLGDAAAKNTGTAAGTVAAGDHNHTGTYEPASADFTAKVTAASDSAAGKVELATTAEVTTGTDTARAVTPASLSGYRPAAEAYDATNWDSDTEAPQKDAVRDKIETLAPKADPVFTGSMAIPQGASPTTDAAGECAMDTTTGQIQCHDGTAERAWPNVQTLSIVISAPADTDDLFVMKAPYGMTILGIDGIVGAATNVVGQLQECASDGTSCTDLDSDITFDADGAADDGTLTDSAIASGAWLKWKTTSVSGTPGHLAVTVRYRVVPD